MTFSPDSHFILMTDNLRGRLGKERLIGSTLPTIGMAMHAAEVLQEDEA